MSAPWQRVKDQLVLDGTMTEQNVTRTPKPRHCRHCGRAVIAAITDAGFEIAVEPTPTTPAGELHTLINGGKTFAILDHAEMVWRDIHRITYRDANKERTHAMHECEKRAPEINPIFAKAKTRIHPHTEAIPF